jgi:hypothetical protein
VFEFSKKKETDEDGTDVDTRQLSMPVCFQFFQKSIEKRLKKQQEQLMHGGGQPTEEDYKEEVKQLGSGRIRLHRKYDTNFLTTNALNDLIRWLDQEDGTAGMYCSKISAIVDIYRKHIQPTVIPITNVHVMQVKKKMKNQGKCIVFSSFNGFLSRLEKR